jgi:hypothetical protein
LTASRLTTLWTLVPAAAIYGLAAALLFRRLVDEKRLRGTVNRMMAHVMEFRLFLDSPALVLRAQRDLARENVRLLRLIALPCLVLAGIFTILFPPLDALYGHEPLRAGEPSVVTVPMSDAALTGVISLETPPGIEVETPGVRVLHDRQISWRIRPLGAASGELKVRYGGRALTRRIVTGSGAGSGPGSGAIHGWRLPFTRPAIAIPYPRTAILGVNWMVWFFLISSAAAIGYRR